LQVLARRILRGGSIVAHPTSHYFWLEMPDDLRADRKDQAWPFRFYGAGGSRLARRRETACSLTQHFKR
jgi:hypothetical protein